MAKNSFKGDLKMKKLTALLLVLTVFLGLFVGCAEKKEEPETTGSTESTGTTDTTDTAGSNEPEYTTLTIAEALAMQLTEGQPTAERYLISGTVASIDNAQYGAMTITDGTDSIYVYNSNNADGTVNYSQMEDRPYAGDSVKIYGTLKVYNGTVEIDNGWIIEYTPAKVEIDDSQYTEMTIAQAREAATGTKIKVTGVVAQFTYAFGQIPSGVYLVDGTNSIYVFDSDLAARVKIGNQITVAASKDYWILEDEQVNAAKFGYKGCNQLTSAVLVSNDGGSHEFDKSWITETTVKEIMETPVTEDITTTIFKVTALVKKVPGEGFVNYYIDDLDGTTGSYCYSQCSGSDFAWLDAYDGKICTVYLSVINAKSKPAECLYRFLPVAVIDENFDVSTVNPAEYAVKYHGVDQFSSTYTGDPKLELLTSVSSDLLNFKDAKLSYSSSDNSVISFTASGSKVIMNCLKSGTVTVTVTGTYGGKTYSQTVKITVDIPVKEITGISVSEAINTAAGTTVTVKGIVGPSIVYPTRVGFYLIDETGVIAVVTDADTMATLTLGDEVVLEGLRTVTTKGGTEYYGQTGITDARVVMNNYGKHDYSTKTFIEGKTLADLAALNVKEDHTTEVYVVKATVNVIETAYYTTINLSYNGTEFELYMSSASQYNFLKEYNGQAVTLEIAPCNWNSKNFYKGCVLAVVHEDGSKTVNELNFT